MFGIYLAQQRATGNMYPEFDADVRRVQWYSQSRYIYAAIGAVFALTVWNPNFIRRRAWYMKKVSLGIWTLIGWQYGRKWYNDEMTFTLLKAYDYLPLETKRAMMDQDFRHLALFDLDEVDKSRPMWDPETKKSLS